MLDELGILSDPWSDSGDTTRSVFEDLDPRLVLVERRPNQRSNADAEVHRMPGSFHSGPMVHLCRHNGVHVVGADGGEPGSRLLLRVNGQLLRYSTPVLDVEHAAAPADRNVVLGELDRGNVVSGQAVR